MNFLQLTRDKLSVEAINDLVADETCGAISLFVGTTRNNFEDKTVLSLEYEAYEPMAIKVMKQICDDIRTKWADIKNIAIYHRLGLVPVKEASVIIAICSPHRKSSLDALTVAIDELKKSVPIWKKEQYDNECSSWKENSEYPLEPKRLKYSKLNFNACQVDTDPISNNLIQIGADESEISRRIHCFVEKKREEIDLNNILDFTATKRTVPESVGADSGEEGESCARVNAIVHKQKDSKGHLKVHRVKNDIGPQTKPDYLNALDKLMKSERTSESQKIKQEPITEVISTRNQSLPFALQERLENAENFLSMKVPNTRHIYERIKAIENKILFLESLSPEYKNFFSSKSMQTAKPTVQKKVYSVDEIDGLINSIKEEVNYEKIIK